MAKVVTLSSPVISPALVPSPEPMITYDGPCPDHSSALLHPVLTLGAGSGTREAEGGSLKPGSASDGQGSPLDDLGGSSSCHDEMGLHDASLPLAGVTVSVLPFGAG